MRVLDMFQKECKRQESEMMEKMEEMI